MDSHAVVRNNTERSGMLFKQFLPMETFLNLQYKTGYWYWYGQDPEDSHYHKNPMCCPFTVPHISFKKMKVKEKHDCFTIGNY